MDISVQFPGISIVHQKIRAHEVGEHQHPGYEFFMPLQGEIRIKVAEKELKAGPGRMICLPPDTMHSFRSDSASQGERLILIIEARAWEKNGGGSMSSVVISASQLCKEILFQLLIHPKTRAAKSLIETLIQTLSEMVEDVGPAFDGAPLHLSGQSNDQRVKAALAIIEEHFATPLSIQEIARRSGMSVRNLNRLFLSELGTTPKQVVTLHRIEHAKKLLLTGRISVTDTALEVGYGSVSQFISMFRKATGQLPSDFFPLKS